MYSPAQLVKKYIHYYLQASNGKGHGIHSPFVFTFIHRVLNDKTKFDYFEKIELTRHALSGNMNLIDVEDFGAGSAIIKTRKRVIHKIASTSLKHKKYAQLLHRMVHFYQPQTIIELGTSFGISTAYMASANPESKLYTLEGSPGIASIAQKHFDDLSLANIKLITGNFEDTLQPLLEEIEQVDLAFIDGNHRKEPTLDYFSKLIAHAGPLSIIILDDIHWSEGMEAAWAEIQNHSAVTLTIDLFFMGVVFVNPDFKVKQHFKIRF